MRTRPLILALAGAALALALPSVSSAALTLLHSFGGPEGSSPTVPLVQGADGFLYGVAPHGGNLAVLAPDGGGTAFRLDLSGNLTTLHVFSGPDGAVPSGLIQGRDGYFYGTTTYGGRDGMSSLEPGPGTIFRMDAAGAVLVLHVFGGAANGVRPGPIVQGSDGALYGTAVGGVEIYAGTGVYAGFVYRFDPATRSFRHLHDFVVSDGRTPTGPLFQGGDGFFYGTTNEGGAWNSGVVYKVDANGNFALLHALSPLFPGEGSEPKGGVIQASDGLFYGTTELGGYGGEIFGMSAAGNFTVLHRFDAYFSDGGRPVSGLIEARDGLLYGTAPAGGQPVTATSRRGVVYGMDKTGAVSLIHTFTGPDGAMPWAALVQGADGALYGSTIAGGAFGLGVLFRITPQASAAPALTSLSLSPTQVAGGSPATGTVTLSAPAPTGGATVSLTSSSSLASTPSSVTVAAGSTTATFPVTTSTVTSGATVTITASYGGQSRSATLSILASSSVKLGGLTLSPTVVRGGTRSIGTVKLTSSAPAGGAVVALKSSSPAVASVPASVTVAAGASSASFTVTTVRVTGSRSVTISASYGGVTKTATLMVLR